ncbi:MAG: alpha/beta fold hydrolase [Nakamurella sp.]
MRLQVREWGGGRRVAVLIHGAMSDSRTWCRVGPLLAEHGYRVLAPDLRGHGLSPRAEYAPGGWGEDLPESLPGPIDLAIGHSLGGQALAAAVDRLMPARAVYYEPAWHIDGSPDTARLFTARKTAGVEQIAADHPDWAHDDVQLELEMLRRWDVETVPGLTTAGDYTPTCPCVPSLVQVAAHSALISQAMARRLQDRGFTVLDLPSAEHAMHRNDPEGFMATLSGWI